MTSSDLLAIEGCIERKELFREILKLCIHRVSKDGGNVNTNRKKISKILSQIKDCAFLTSDGFYKDAIVSIEEAFAKKPFRIALVGEFSTGKSTFINALLGRDLLSHATEEVTAAITNIHNVECEDKKWHSCDVVFSNGKVEHLVDESQLLDYTTTKSKVTNVVNSIKSVDYYTDFMDPSIDVVLVDTPGLNGMADGHRELTLQEVKRADFCIYLVGIRGLAETDKVILKEMSYYQKNFVFVINFIDQLKASEGEAVEEKIKEINEILMEDILSDCKINYEIFGVSALKGLAGKDKSIRRLYQGDTSDICDEERQLLYEESNLQEVETYIGKHINNATIDKLTVDRVRHMLINMLDSAIEDLEERKERIDYLRCTDNDNKKLKVMEERLSFFIESSKKNKEKVINYAESECSSIRREFMEYLQKSLENMRNKYIQKLMKFERYEDLERYVKSNELDAEVKVDADKMYDYVEDNMLHCLNDILNNILVRIQEYLKDSQINSSNQVIDFEVKKGIKRTDADVLAAESALAETKIKESEARNKANSARSIRENEERKIREAEQKFIRAKNNLQVAVNKKETKLSRLGEQPAVEKITIYTTETYYDEVYRGGFFGGIVDIFCGPKSVKKTRQVPHTSTDDSKRKAWVKERDRILASCNPEIERLQEALDADKNRIVSAKRMIKKAKVDEQQAKEDLLFYQQKYDNDKKTLDNLKKKANQELLNSLRNSLISQLEKYCDYNGGNIATVIKDYVNETIEINRTIICERTADFYETRLESLISVYKNEIDGKVESNNQKYVDYESELTKIKHIRKELEYAR